MTPNTNTEATTEATSRANQVVSNEYAAYVVKILGGIAVMILFFLIAKIIANIVKRSMMRGADKNNYESTKKVANLISTVVFYIMVLIALFIGFDIMGVNLGLLIGGISFGLGLAFKELLGNMFAGIMILYTKEFKIGDIIEIAMGKGYFGRIEEISIRYTVIRTLDLRQVVIPNITLITVPVKTFSSEELVRLDTVIGIHYNSDVAKAIELIVQTINEFDFVKEKNNTKAYVLNLGDSSIDLKCLFFFNPNSGILGEVALGYIQERAFEVLKENGISIPYNQTTLTFENEESKKRIQAHLENKTGNSNIGESMPIENASPESTPLSSENTTGSKSEDITGAQRQDVQFQN